MLILQSKVLNSQKRNICLMASRCMDFQYSLPGKNIPDMQMQTENRYFFFEGHSLCV